MKILADESLDGPVVAWLRAQGHDVTWATESCSGVSDEAIVDQACNRQCVIVTSDRDFGELVFRHGRRPPGVALLRFRTKSAAEFLGEFERHWPAIEARLIGCFVVAGRGRIRARRMNPTHA